MEANVDGLIGAGRYERSDERATYRNGHRDRAFDTRLGSLQRQIVDDVAAVLAEVSREVLTGCAPISECMDRQPH